MRRFFNNTRGAVTVFVTLLLIPAMLVSGTAVDLARIHTAQGIMHDANQLAANAVLTQYNALLYDIYGLMGVAEDDPILWALLDEYIKVSVFGETGQDRGLGTLQLFYGSNISMEDVYFKEDKNLSEVDVLRRQIEDYMKFRGPVIIVEEFIKLLDASTIQEDASVIEDKLKIESAIGDIYEKYKELYNAILYADRLDQVNGGVVGATVGTVSSGLDLIRGEFVQLYEAYTLWEMTGRAPGGMFAHKYEAIRNNIRSRTVGGAVRSEWNNGVWEKTTNPQGLNKTIENAIQSAENAKARFDKVVEISRDIDKMKEDLIRRLDDIEDKVKNGQCSDDLREALTKKEGSPAMSIIDRYRDILKWNNLEGMAATYKDGAYGYLDKELKPLLEGVVYRNAGNPSAGRLTRAELASITTDSRFALSNHTISFDSMAARFAAFLKDDVTYKVPPGFKKYADHPGGNREFFNKLESFTKQPKAPPVKLFDEQEEDEEGDTTEEKQENMIKELLELVEKAYIGLSNSPLGARHIYDKGAPKLDKLNLLDMANLIPQISNDPILGVLTSPVSKIAEAGDYLLLLTYCSSVFSNYTTTRPDSIGKTRDDLDEIEFPKSMTSAQICPKVNYFFQSEWEYLYSGNDNAGKNLNAITRLLFLVRFVCNYITAFSVPEITTVVKSIYATFAWAPALAVFLGELARGAFTAAESLVDVAALRTGHKVPLIKRAVEWVCSPSGIKKALADLNGKNPPGGGGKDGGEKGEEEEGEEEKERGLTYSNYMLVFFVAKAVFDRGDAGAELAVRTGKLIEWNIVNYKNDVYSDEGKMTEALARSDRFKLSDMNTDFSITTTVDMRMLFLSMVFAQNYSDSRGIGMPKTMPVSATDYRGY